MIRGSYAEAERSIEDLGDLSRLPRVTTKTPAEIDGGNEGRSREANFRKVIA